MLVEGGVTGRGQEGIDGHAGRALLAQEQGKMKKQKLSLVTSKAARYARRLQVCRASQNYRAPMARSSGPHAVSAGSGCEAR